MNKDKYPIQFEENRSRMIIYYDSMSCNLCEISHLQDLLKIYEVAEMMETFDVVTVFAPKAEEYNDIVTRLEDLAFEYPIYADKECSLLAHNPWIPAENYFHCFLTDRSGKPIFVGNPTASNNLWIVFNEAVNTLPADY